MPRVAPDTLERDRAISVQAANDRELQGALAQLEWSDIRAVKGEGASMV